MVKVGVVGSILEGNDGGEHNGHVNGKNEPLHPTSPMTGKILSGCGFAFIKGKEIANVGSVTVEECSCCGGKISGTVTDVPNFVYANGKKVVMLDQTLTPHHGTLMVKTGVIL